MNLSLNEQEKQAILQCINTTVKVSDNSLQVASQLLPLAIRISELKEPEEPKAE